MTNKEILDKANRLMSEVTLRSFEMGRVVGESHKLESNLQKLGQHISLTEINKNLEKLKNYDSKSTKKFMDLILMDLDDLIKIAGGKCDFLEDVGMSNIPIETYESLKHKRRLLSSKEIESWAKIVDESIARISAIVASQYIARPEATEVLFESKKETKEDDTRLEGFKNILKNDDIME